MSVTVLDTINALYDDDKSKYVNCKTSKQNIDRDVLITKQQYHNYTSTMSIADKSDPLRKRLNEIVDRKTDSVKSK